MKTTAFSPVPDAQTTIAAVVDHGSFKSRRTATCNAVNVNSILPYVTTESDPA